MAVGYGSDGSAIAKTLGMPIEDAKRIVSNMLSNMPGMAAFKKRTIKFLKEHGYIIINEITGHRVYWPEWATWKAEEDRYDRQFWDEYRMYHKGTDDEVAQRVRKHMSESGDWFNKNVLNYPIQGGSAVVLKQAAADLFEWVVKNGYFNIIKFCVFVHDEIDCECPESMKDLVANKVSEIMKNASAKFYHKLPIPADSSIEKFWVH